MDVKQALSDWKAAGDTATAADGTLGSAQAKQAEIQAELDAAVTGTATAKTADDSAWADYDTKTDVLVAALVASKHTQAPPA